MNRYIFLLLAITWVQCIPQCKEDTEKVANLHGVMQIPTPEIPITICNSTSIVKNQPISLDSYQEYLKIQNNLQKIYANTFSLLPNVKTLTATFLGLTSIETDGLKGLLDLRYLNLAGNQLENLPETLFDDTPNLIELNLEYNHLNQIHAHQFDRLINLQKLRLGKNQLRDLPTQWHTGLHSLKYLTLNDNRLTILKSGMFESLTNLDTLRLNNNDITSVQAGAFSGLSRVNSLTLQYNRNIAPPHLLDEIKTLTSLRGLSVSPPGLECTVWGQLQDWADTSNIELVQIPAERVCWTL